MDKIPMTPAGHAALSEEYRQRTSEERPRSLRDISEARAHGDLSENAEYHAAKEQQSLNEGRIQELEALLALADIIDVTKLCGSTVKFGATVKIVDEDSEEEKQLHDRRRRRGGRQQGPHLDFLAHRPRHDRQVQGRQLRSLSPPAAPRATRSSSSNTSEPPVPSCAHS